MVWYVAPNSLERFLSVRYGVSRARYVARTQQRKRGQLLYIVVLVGCAIGARVCRFYFPAQVAGDVSHSMTHTRYIIGKAICDVRIQ